MNWLSHHTLSNEDSWHARNTINPSAGRKEWNFPSNLIFELTFQHPELMIKCALQEPFCAEKQQTITPGDKRPCCPPGGFVGFSFQPELEYFSDVSQELKTLNWMRIHKVIRRMDSADRNPALETAASFSDSFIWFRKAARTLTLWMSYFSF